MTEQAQRQPFWEVWGLPAPGTQISFADYEALPEIPFHIEWHDGIVIYPNWNEDTMAPSPMTRHQRLVVRLLQLLPTLQPEGDWLTAPMDLRLGGRVVQPDVFWVAADGACVDQGSHYAGPPDLVVEVLSPSNTENDRVTKFDLYEREGVREYWIVNPTENYLEVYALAEGTYRRVGAFKPGAVFESTMLGASVSVTDLFDV